MAKYFTLLALMLLVALPAFGQQYPGLDRSNYSVAAYYSYAEPGETPIMVNVWGTVRAPGLYEVKEGTTLSTLLSLSGGPAVMGRTPRERRTIVLRLNRGDELVADISMDDEVSRIENDVVLQEGDILTVDTVVRQRFNWREVFPIISAASSVAVALFYFTQLGN